MQILIQRRWEQEGGWGRHCTDALLLTTGGRFINQTQEESGGCYNDECSAIWGGVAGYYFEKKINKISLLVTGDQRRCGGESLEEVILAITLTRTVILASLPHNPSI